MEEKRNVKKKDTDHSCNLIPDTATSRYPNPWSKSKLF